MTTLRKEHFDPIEGKVWTQKILADQANLSERTIGELERGKKAILDQHTLQKIASALKLNTREQYQFFYAAMNIEQYIPVNKTQQKQILQEAIEDLSTICAPVMIHDNLNFVLAANKAWLRLMEGESCTNFKLQSPASRACELNYMHILLDESLPLKSLYGNNWKKFLSKMIGDFRISSLQYCYKDQYHRLLKSLLKHSFFIEEWQGYINHNTNVEELQCESKDHYVQGKLEPIIYKQSILASFGELYSVTYRANSNEINDFFSQLSEGCEGQIYKFAEWGTN